MYNYTISPEVAMSYPREFLYIFPALPYLPQDIVINFVDDPFVKLFAKQVIEKRHHWFSKIYKFDQLTRNLTELEITELFSAFKNAEKISRLYYWAIIEHKPDRPMLDKESIQPLINAYEQLSILYENLNIKLSYESVGIFLHDEDNEEEQIEILERDIRKLRRRICLSNLNQNVKQIELDAICQQYPILNPIKTTLLEGDFNQIHLTIYNYFLERLNNGLSTQYSLDLKEEKNQLARSLIASIINDDEDIYQKQTVLFLKSVEQKVLDELNKYAYENSSLLTSGISQLFSEFVNDLIGHTDRIAQAYQFIQYTGFGSQSDFFIFDVYSAIRNSGKISEFKQITYGLLKPFHPLFHEYQSIGLYETNEFRKIVRALIPLLIATGVFIAITAVLAPLGLPEIAFMVTLIPSLFIGLGIASVYCKFKDNLYQSFRQYYYGGQYQLPEFKVNERMIFIFGDSASIVQNYYINALKNCKEIEDCCASREDIGLLTELESKLRIKNRQQFHVLINEWHDIHQNHQITQEKVKSIVDKRLNSEIDSKLSKLSAKVTGIKKKELHAWNSQAQKTTDVTVPLAQLPKLVTKLGIFKETKERINREVSMYATVIESITNG